MGWDAASIRGPRFCSLLPGPVSVPKVDCVGLDLAPREHADHTGILSLLFLLCLLCLPLDMPWTGSECVCLTHLAQRTPQWHTKLHYAISDEFCRRHLAKHFRYSVSLRKEHKTSGLSEEEGSVFLHTLSGGVKFSVHKTTCIYFDKSQEITSLFGRTGML